MVSEIKKNPDDFVESLENKK
ncbi:MULTISPECIES: hypothetical protein [Bacillus cereus group]